MLKLAFDREPFWLDMVPGVRMQFRPITVAAILLARTAAADALRAGGDDAMVKAGCAFTRSLAHSGIAAWEGIGDADGNPVEPTKETIDAALEVWPLFDAIDRLYVGPALIQDAEKNA
ncbi:MAG: hypothetical protein BroJett024_42260 [Alphaproteobacteria bacterium]|nr:MAG: hypothetical protein BroJett024_42260 [Alphaproteobacteria bacterium]